MCVFLIINLSTIDGFTASDSPNLSKHDFLSWPVARSDKFGCFLEKTFKHKDKKFNCGLKGYINRGDPCKNTDAYYEGPKFPEDQVRNVHPLIQEITLDWEHGVLQGLSFTLNKKLSTQDVRKQLNLPLAENFPRENVMSVSIQQCSDKLTCVVIQGFSHMGAGDADCGEGEN
jgi:hypothetical protein